ncbi:chaperone NapD [Campylobacter concisus]|uniref:chaperone NapD n=1 Tax=Campylobacter concisus TaxID=199 RepID=UPI00122CE2F3|nr:chaperone NapD [Campylobacter concisus]
MNISSLIVYTDNKNESVKNEIKKLNECEVITDADDRIVVVVSSDSIEDEIKNFKKIEAISGVVSVVMVYSYQEDAEENRKKLEENGKISEILTSDEVKAEDITYGGSVHHRVK